MKVNRRKTEYMCVSKRQDNGSSTVKMLGEEVAKVEHFKYLGSTVQSNGECGREVKKSVQAGWNGWRRMSGVICDRRVPARVKGKVHKAAVRPAMLYGLATVALTKIQEAEMEVAELKMLRFSLGVRTKWTISGRRFMDVVKEDMAEVEATEEDTEVETAGEGKSAVATPDGKSRKKKKLVKGTG